MTDMPDETERGDIEPTLRDVDESDAPLRAALQKDRQQAQQVRRDARAAFRAMDGWQRVRSEEDWLKVCADSPEQYESQGDFSWNGWGPSGTWTPSGFFTSSGTPLTCRSASGA
jgi:hypothetical protein